GRDKGIGIDVAERQVSCTERLAAERERLAKLETEWQKEKEIVDDILARRAELRGELSDADRETKLGELRAAQARLRELQGERPLILLTVDQQAGASVVADWTGIPVGRMVKDEIATVLNLAGAMAKRVIGQDHAMELIARRIKTSRANLDNPGKPIGVFMLAGPSGVGKTETALTLAENLYGGEQNVIT